MRDIFMAVTFAINVTAVLAVVGASCLEYGIEVGWGVFSSSLCASVATLILHDLFSNSKTK